MENMYVFVLFVAMVIALVGVGLMKFGDLLEQRRDEKNYRMIREDAAFWQMKIEQTIMNSLEWVLDEGIDKVMEKSMEMTKKMYGVNFEDEDEESE